jgi:hypothetical protein
VQPRLLGDVLGTRLVAYIAQRQADQRRVMLLHEPGECRLVALTQGRDHLLLARIDLDSQGPH